jgi:hypothetical protein
MPIGVVSEDIDVSVVSYDLEVAVIRRQPTIEHLLYFHTPIRDPETPRCLLTPIPAIAIHSDIG